RRPAPTPACPEEPVRNRCLPFLLGLAVLPALADLAAAAPQDGPAPLFSRHVAAVFSRLGCNGGTCHGAVKGQNGFRLSLFGADPAQDHDRLLREFGGRRLNRADPAAGLLLLKATAPVSPQGGKRMEADSPEYEVLRRWIAAGAALDPHDRSRVSRLQVTPSEQTARPGEGYQLRVQATFADGSTEDVTSLCSFESLDRQVATAGKDGRAQARGLADTALIVRYRAVPALATVGVPLAGPEAFPDATANHFIDGHVLGKLRRLNVPPSPTADDGTLLRRMSLDVTGELPAPAEVRAFLADSAPDRRARKIDDLLHRRGH